MASLGPPTEFIQKFGSLTPPDMKEKWKSVKLSVSWKNAFRFLLCQALECRGMPIPLRGEDATDGRASQSTGSTDRSYRLPATNALKSLSLEVPTAFTE